MTAAVTGAPASDLVSGPLPRAIMRVAVPAIGSALLQLAFLLIDVFWVGRTLGPAALAAISTAGFAVWMLLAVGEMIAVGLTAVAARRHGEGAPALAAVASGTTLMLALVTGVVVAIVGWQLLPALFAVMRTPPEVTALGRTWLSTYLLGTPLVLGFYAAEATFRASGDTRTPLALLSLSVLVTLVMDPVLILGLGPAPAMGIAGAAVAAVGTRALGLAFGFGLLVRRRLLRFAARDWRAGLAVLRIGLPTAANGIFFALIYIGLTRITTRFGTPALAALGVGHKLEGLAYQVAVGFGLASAAIVGQNLGAGRADRARRAGWLSVRYACMAAGVVALAFLLAPRQLVAVFSRDAAVVAAGASYLRIIALAEITMAVEIVLEGSLGGAGFTLEPTLWSGSLSAARLPLAAWLAGVLGVAGIWWTISLTAVGRGIAMAGLWRSGRWQRARA
ncbi:MAG TPA: MATE family efflux transporter [Gemmatimonadales bacterium]|nr:MATE family efflux transporter [Gemmatimonadales bacterium]